MARGVSRLENPLDSLDARSCAAVCEAFGAEIIMPAKDGAWTVRGLGGAAGLRAPQNPLDVGNSGTTLFLALAVAALNGRPSRFTGDKQIARRSAAPLLDALSKLGARIDSDSGCIPITVRGPLQSGRVSLPCPTSQYLSALLLAVPLAAAGTVIEIDVPLLNERPYIEMTLSYLDTQGVKYSRRDDFSYFRIEGGAEYSPVNGEVPGDFSSAAFPALAAALSGGELVLHNLDRQDSQGDKVFFDILQNSGCTVVWSEDERGKRVRLSRSGVLRAGNYNLNDTPDLLPACAVLAAFADGESRLYNVAHARIKETDRIAVMARALCSLGVNCEELPDGLIIKGRGGVSQNGKTPVLLDGCGDHRVVMALACAALATPCGITITGAEAADVTYPQFLGLVSPAS
jgi:3-phosphoshikimate 1-carboxyvinyltransferase